MFSFIKGKVVENGSNYITLENNGIGYLIFVANPFSFQINEEKIIYIYTHIREDEFSLYGFNTMEEKELFLRLINVKGLGPKMALPMLASGSVSGIIDAIDRENILYLTKFPKIGEKIARQIVLDLKGKLSCSDNNTPDGLEEVVEVLESLGYKNSDIKRILPKINKELKVEEQVKEALKLLLK
jgi:Holliday junction DNA helicase RuvA